jgi:hypothetical protein
MAKKKAAASKAAASKAAAVEPVGKPVRLVLSQEDHDRLRVCAAKSRLSMSSYARMVVMKAVDATEGGH